MKSPKIYLAILAMVPVLIGIVQVDVVSEAGTRVSPVLLGHEGKRYVLNYFGESGTVQDRETVPESIYDSLDSWCFNAHSAGVLTALDCFRIAARLATVDERSRWGFSINPDAFGFWRDSAWSKHASTAVYPLTDALKGDPRVETLIIAPLVALGIADRVDVLKIYFKSDVKLSNKQRNNLVAIFNVIENEFRTEPRLLAITTTVEESAKMVPSHYEARKATLSVFSLER